MLAPTTDRVRSRSQLDLGIWLAVSLVAHGVIALALFARSPAPRMTHAPEAPLWLEPLAPVPPPSTPVPAASPKPLDEPPKRAAARPSRAPRALEASTAPAPAPEPGGAPPAAITAEEGTFAVGPSGTGLGGSGRGKGVGQGDGNGRAGAAPEAQVSRRKGAPELSLWMDPGALEQRALVRRAIDLLMSVPGYRDAVRGSGLSPFGDLQRLRVSLQGVGPERLMLAGVHLGGERALLDMAQRIAAMRARELTWRGDSSLRATSWVDGSGIDRGLAVHDGAFAIAARAALPAALGDDPEKQVIALSRMRDRIMTLLTIEDVPRYFPSLEPCALQALRISVDDEYRMALTAHYDDGASASEAGNCLRALAPSTARLARFVDWLAQAQSAPNSFSTKLQMGVSNEDLEQLLGELAWALRNT